MLSFPTAVLTALIAISIRAGRVARSTLQDRVRWSAREEGQATAEYALVLLGAAAIALALTAWALKSGAIGRLFDTVVDQLIGKAG